MVNSSQTEASSESLTYADAGVNLTAADEAVDRIGGHAKRTHSPGVLPSTGGFGGLYEIDLERWKRPVMVTATDGVGTKLELARQLGLHRGVGIDLVAMVVDDIVVSGAEPQVFLDYIAIGKLDPTLVEELVAGIADGCEQAGCSLIGGETAEHPGIMPPADYDLAGFAVGLVERDEILTGDTIAPGDQIVAMASNGFHSNGYSLIRRIVDNVDLSQQHGLDQSLGEELLTPTQIYTKPCLALHQANLVSALCHVTGGGLPGNIPRVLPEGMGAAINTSTWTAPPVFELIQNLGNVATDEMFNAFNMGVGMAAITAPAKTEETVDVLGRHGIEAWVCGSVTDTGRFERS